MVSDRLTERLARLSDRGLGDVQMRSNFSLNSQAQAVARGARNLLSKARRDLAAGRPERAGSYIDRALALPPDGLIGAPTGVWAAHMILFTTVAEALEAAPEGNSRWLDAAEAALARCGGHAREDLLLTLRSLDLDHHLPPAERRRVRTLTSGDGRHERIEEHLAPLIEGGVTVQRAAVIEVLLATTIYEQELARLVGIDLD